MRTPLTECPDRGSAELNGPYTIARISVDVGVGVKIAAVALGLNAGGLSVITAVMVGIVSGFVAFYIIKKPCSGS